MTKTTLRALVGGGGLIATWLAVSPGPQAPVAPAGAPPPRAVEARTQADDDLSAQTEQLHRREAPSELKPATRNPFRFGVDRDEVRSGLPAAHAQDPAAMLLPPPPPPPALTLSGIAEKRGDAGVRRTAVISADARLYVASEGDVVEGRYTIITIDAEAVLLRDFAGGELLLTLRP